MILKSIKLHNIRSYESVEINFPIGSTLLAGDIGSGKSTILLAIEFAIFGAKKGELPAYTLLRHGKKEGSVELRMHIDNKDVLIKRTLRRSNDDIRQEAGYIIISGIKKEGTTEELRALMLDLLGYPKDLVKKGKDLIYRYTVYTPQEEMKQILYEGKETRLDTLRKIFGIDKYKTIKENSRIVVTYLREKKKHFEGFIIDLEYKKREMEERKNEVLELDRKINGIMPKIDEIKKIINEKKKSADAIENDVLELNKLRKELSVTETSLAHFIEHNNRLDEDMKKLDKQIVELKKEVEDKSPNELGYTLKKIEEKEKEIVEADTNYSSTIKKIRELEVKIEHCNETIKKIQTLEICPVCEQKVSDKHKHDINLREDKRCERLIEEIKNHKEEELKLEKIRMELKKELNSLIKEQNYFNILKIKFENFNEKNSLMEEKLILRERARKEISFLSTKKGELSSKIQDYSEVEEKHKIVKKEVEELLPQERFLELEKRKYESEKESIKRFVTNLEKEVYEKQIAKEKLAYILQLINWIEELFINLLLSIERHVMINIHFQFSSLFKNWFNVLLEDETINVRVDDEFTPLIEQDGYETYIDNLSGGEKTSVALAYRLSLNKVVNDIIAGIKTKDIIMLDEPTDGFSTEQLDKIRDVLEQLGMRQVIIVSHESKIESFVDYVIKVQKHEHVSVVS